MIRGRNESIARFGLSGVLTLLLLLAAGGCAVVAPYERETLARRDMQLQRNADASAGELHANAYREGSAGAEGSSGGGCGCN